MSLTLAEKLIRRASGAASVRPGDYVVVKVDLAMIHDSGGPRRVAPLLRELGAGLFDPRKVVLISDHYVPGDTPAAEEILSLTRNWAAETGVHFYDGEGICHVVLPERGHLAPGKMVVGGDSHSTTGGAFGCYMFGIGATEMAGVLATGEIWLEVPRTIRLDWTGALPEYVVAKDMMLAMCAKLGMNGGKYQAIEYTGSTIAGLSMQDRMTLSNMGSELGAQAALIAPDQTTADYVRSVGGVVPDDIDHWQTDDAAKVSEHHRFDGASLSPHVAAPHSPANSAPVENFADVKINVAYLGACTGAKYADLRGAADMFRGRKVAPGVQLLVAPASRRDQQRAADEGIMAVLEEAGAKLLPNACGICAGYGAARLGEDDVAISSTARNFKGRMGDAGSMVYLGSPYTVAASAIAGVIADPREFAVRAAS